MRYINEDYCSEELSGMLMEKGYIGAANTYLDKDNLNVKQITIQSAMKWLREVHNLEIYPYHDMFQENNKWWYGIEKFTKGCSNCQYEEEPIYSTYEEACEAAIKYCLENLIQDEERRKIKSL